MSANTKNKLKNTINNYLVILDVYLPPLGGSLSTPIQCVARVAILLNVLTFFISCIYSSAIGPIR